MDFEDLFPEKFRERFKDSLRDIKNSIAKTKAGRKYDMIEPKYGPYENAPVYRDDGTYWFPDEVSEIKNDATGDTIGYAKNRKHMRVDNRRIPETGDPNYHTPRFTLDNMPGVIGGPDSEDKRYLSMPPEGMDPDKRQM
jgi:hypothetical protein